MTAAGREVHRTSLGAVAGRVRDGVQALRIVVAEPDLRRVQLCFGTVLTGEWILIVALGVWAFDVGGAIGVGLLTVARTIPAAVVGPFLALVADRCRRDHVLMAVSLLRAALLSVVALALASDAPVVVVYVVAATDACIYSLFWPAQSALVRELARRPEALVAANVTTTALENVGALVGPVLAAVLLSLTSSGPAVACIAYLIVAGSLVLLPLLRAQRPAPLHDGGGGGGSALLAGFRHLAADRRSSLVAGLFLLHSLGVGGLTVLLVVLALDTLQLGEAGVGLLMAGVGAGGLVGALAALGLAGNPRLARVLAGGVIVWGAVVLLLGVTPLPALAVGLLAVAGASNAISDVAGLTLLQRLVPERLLGRVLGIVEGVWWGVVGIGGLAASLLAEWLGPGAAVGVLGLLLISVAVAARGGTHGIDRAATVPTEALEVLVGDRIIGPLPTMALERLALAAVPLSVPAGTVVIREGDVGDYYYALRSGAVEATADGWRRHLGPGEGFGEIALLHAVRRTATVTALEPAELLRIDREAFLTAMGAHHPGTGT